MDGGMIFIFLVSLAIITAVVFFNLSKPATVETCVNVSTPVEPVRPPIPTTSSIIVDRFIAYLTDVSLYSTKYNSHHSWSYTVIRIFTFHGLEFELSDKQDYHDRNHVYSMTEKNTFIPLDQCDLKRLALHLRELDRLEVLRKAEEHKRNEEHRRQTILTQLVEAPTSSAEF